MSQSLSSQEIISLSHVCSVCTNSNKTNRVANEGCLVLFPLHPIRNPVTMTPVRDPDDFLGGGRHKAWPVELRHAVVHKSLHGPPLPLKKPRIEGHRIGPTIGQWRQMRKPLRVIEHTHDPEMVEHSFRPRSVSYAKPHRRSPGGSIQCGNFQAPEIVREYRASEVQRLDEEGREFGHAGSDVETATPGLQLRDESSGQPKAEDLAGFPFGPPKRLAAFVAVDPAQRRIVESGENLGESSDGGSGDSWRHGELSQDSARACVAAVTASATAAMKSRFNVSSVSVGWW